MKEALGGGYSQEGEWRLRGSRQERGAEKPAQLWLWGSEGRQVEVLM